MGKPTDEDTYYGPMARNDLRDELDSFETIAGGRLVLGEI
jgi:succinate-semialdehyde dehydrogenase/glutarate-semialdehyde dehydrogenase